MLAIARVQTQRKTWKERIKDKKEGDKLKGLQGLGGNMNGAVDGARDIFTNGASPYGSAPEISSSHCPNELCGKDIKALDDFSNGEDHSDGSEESEVIL